MRYSNDTNNDDKADQLAKDGRYIDTHVPSQTVTLLWDQNLPLDKDIRKCIGKIIDYKRLDNHLNHQDLSDIRNFTKNHLFNWVVSSKFFHHNSRNNTTCDTHSKDTSWKIKVSTNTLPTLDILNRNFPDLIKDNTTCLLCHATHRGN